MIPALNVQWWRVWCGKSLGGGHPEEGGPSPSWWRESLGKGFPGEMPEFSPEGWLGQGTQQRQRCGAGPSTGTWVRQEGAGRNSSRPVITRREGHSLRGSEAMLQM